MSFVKIKSNLIFSKKNILDLVLINYLLKLGYSGKNVSSNHFVSLKSPFHYKLGKNHLNIESIKINYYLFYNGTSAISMPILGLIESSQIFKKKKYNL